LTYPISSLFKHSKSGVWIYQNYYPDPITGERKRVQKYLGVTDRVVAERRKKDLDQKYGKLRNRHSRKNQTLRSHTESHVKQREELVLLGRLSPHTLRTEIGVLRLFVREMEAQHGPILLKAISKTHISEYARKGRTVGFLHERGESGKPVSDATIAIHLRHLKSFFGNLIPWINSNPVTGISIPSVKRRSSAHIPTDHIWTELSEQLEKNIRSNPNDIPNYLVLLLTKTGMRIGELMRLKWYPTEPYEQTSGHSRSYSILAPDYSRISIQSKRQERDPLVTHVSWIFEQLRLVSDNSSPFVFCNPETGKVYAYRTFSDRLAQVSLGIGLTTPLTPHSLRHGFITDMIRKVNGNLAFVGKYVGHKNEWMTEHYSHVIDSQEREFIDLIG
jgi:integrase